MANEWFRLWHDMPNDPKWRTISRASGQPISLVLSVALHVMTDASRNVTRGHADVTAEDIASALDVTEADIQAVLGAMQGRIMDGERLTGWEKRQPKKEDIGNSETGAKSAAERKRDQRERDRKEARVGQSPSCHTESREVTTDKDKDKDKKKLPPNPPEEGGKDPDEIPTAKPKRERKERCSLKTFLDRCRAAGETAISGYEPLRKYVDGVELPMEFVQLSWDVFKAEHSPGGANERRLQSDWRKHFLNYVTKGYYRLWYADAASGTYSLTTQGIQAQRLCARKEAA